MAYLRPIHLSLTSCEQYTEFWTDLSSAPMMWLGLLFSIMSLSELCNQKDGDTPGSSVWTPGDRLETYRTLSIQCLVAGDYLQPSKYTIETLALHFALDQGIKTDVQTGDWVLIGVIVRIALRMGLHRDPSHFPSIRPLQAELRRRIWMALYQLDFFTSTQIGLPRIIKDSQCDTRPPTHLLDDDLGLDNRQMPQERPMTEPTTLLYIIQRYSIIRIAAEIYDATETGSPSPKTTAILAAKLEAAVQALPEWLRYKHPDQSIADDPFLILQRMYVNTLVQKATCLLYRRSFTGGENTNLQDLFIRAALTTLEHQRLIDEEIQPGGLMFGIRSKVSSSLNHEFVQATIMLCFALSRTTGENVGLTYKRQDLTEMLYTARAHWLKVVDRSMGAQKAVEVIDFTLEQNAPQTGSILSFGQYFV